MPTLDKTDPVSIRFRVQWRYHGAMGIGRRVARWIHLQLQKVKLRSGFAKLAHESNGTLSFNIEEVVLDNADTGGFVISMSGDTWHMGQYLKAILNEPPDERDQALLAIVRSEFGDLLLANSSVETELDIESYSVGTSPG